jgi:hypothetical protein
MTGEPLAKVLGIAGEHRAISRDAKAVWRRLANAAAIALLVGSFSALPQALNADQGMHYAKFWKVARFLSRELRKLWSPSHGTSPLLAV